MMDWRNSIKLFVRVITFLVSVLAMSLLANSVISESTWDKATHWPVVFAKTNFWVLAGLALAVALFDLFLWRSAEVHALELRKKLDDVFDVLVAVKTDGYSGVPGRSRRGRSKSKERAFKRKRVISQPTLPKMVVKVSESFRRGIATISDSERRAFNSFLSRFSDTPFGDGSGVSRLGKRGSIEMLAFRLGPSLRGIGYFDAAKKALSLVQISRNTELR